MQYLLRGLFTAAAILVLHAPVRAELPVAVAEKLQAAGIPPEAMATVAVRVATGEKYLAHQADRAFQPASTLKLLTALVALERLGPAWRGRSELVSSAPLQEDVLRGDLVLRGSADPDLTAPAFARLLLAVRNQGVREIAGDLLLDATFFAPARTDIGAPPFDETPEFRYNVIPDAIFLNGWLLGLELHSDKSTVRVAMTPALDGVSVESAMTLVERDCKLWEDGWKLPQVEKSADGRIRIRLVGEFPRDCTTSADISVLDRLDFADRLFRALWRDLGGTIKGQVTFLAAPGGRSFGSHHSRALGEMVRDINKDSDNPVTRIVYLALGTLAEGPAGGDTLARSERLVRAWMKEKGIDDAGLVLENGSGLSRTERISASQLAQVRRAARASRWAPEFTAALPIAGVDGGMRRRLIDSPAAANARIKTGTLRDVSAVAGFVEDNAGETFIVVAMINHPRATGSVARPILDAYIDAVARGGAKAGGSAKR